jgi:hypothetical protein
MYKRKLGRPLGKYKIYNLTHEKYLGERTVYESSVGVTQ